MLICTDASLLDHKFEKCSTVVFFKRKFSIQCFISLFVYGSIILCLRTYLHPPAVERMSEWWYRKWMEYAAAMYLYL